MIEYWVRLSFNKLSTQPITLPVFLFKSTYNWSYYILLRKYSLVRNSSPTSAIFVLAEGLLTLLPRLLGQWVCSAWLRSRFIFFLRLSLTSQTFSSCWYPLGFSQPLILTRSRLSMEIFRLWWSVGECNLLDGGCRSSSSSSSSSCYPPSSSW